MRHSAADALFRVTMHLRPGPRPPRPGERPTLAYIESLRSAKGGWTRAALETLGIPWPPPKGWKAALLSGKLPSHANPKA